MIAFISLIYASFYFLVFGKGIVKKSARNMSIFVGIGIVLVGSVVFAWLTVAPNTKDGRVFQYVIPIVPLMALWDGVVSQLRAYTPQELDRLAAAAGAADYEWTTGKIGIRSLPARVTYLVGFRPALC